MPPRVPIEVRMRRFPLADPGSWTETSPQTDDYNCAAWVGVTDANWWPEPEAAEYYWPAGALSDGTIDAFIDGYGTLGFAIGVDGELEAGFEKLVIYGTSRGSPQHVALQLQTGRWTSKLRNEEDVEHTSVDVLRRSRYGEPLVFMRRPRSAT